MSDVSKNLKRIRIERNLTQDELAEKVCVTRQTISNWETGKSQPDIETLVTLGEVLGTDANELIYGNKTNGYIRFQKKYVAMTIVCMVIAAIAVVLDCTIFSAIKNDFNLYFYYSWWLMFATMVIRPFAVFTFGCGVVSAISMFADLSLYKKERLIILLISILLLLIPLYLGIMEVLLLLRVNISNYVWLINVGMSDIGIEKLIFLHIFPFLSGAGLFIATRKKNV